jgi:hypothetical protein
MKQTLPAICMPFAKLFAGFDALPYFGESYAGMYVRAWRVKSIWKTKELKLAADDGNDSVGIPIALAGIALGNGWIDARGEAPLPLIMRIGMECWTIHSRQFACGMGALHQQFNNEDIASGDNKTTRRRNQALLHNVPDDCSMMTAL